MQYSELIEKRKHGTPDFPVEYYYIDKTHPRYVMAAHWHKEFEIIRVLDGHLTVYLNTAKYELGKGECLFIEGGCLKRAMPKDCAYECLVFDAAMLEQQSSLNISELTFQNYIAPEEAEVHQTIQGLLSAMAERQPYYKLDVTGLIYKLFYQLLQKKFILQTTTPTADRGLKTVISLLKWIKKNYTQEITLEKISQYAGLSEKYLCRIFKAYTSKTIMDYVNEIRIEQACVELAYTSVTEAAFNCGFNNLSYFCKLFKKYKGMTPREYKKQALPQK